MKFSEMEYVRPDFVKTGVEFNKLLSEFNNAETFDALETVIRKIDDIRNEIISMDTISYIKYCINTENKVYEEEQNYFDDNLPGFQNLVTEFHKAILNSKFRNDIIKKYGKQLINIAEVSVKSISPAVISEMKKDNHLINDYIKLNASAKILFEGKERNIQQLEPFLESADREVREKAFKTLWKFYEDNSEKFEDIYDEMVKLRNETARKIGYKNYTELGYFIMQRTDYDRNMVENFRKHIRKYVIPLSIKIMESQRQRLGIETLLAHDLPVRFKEGNSSPKGPPEWIVENAKTMYNELSKESGEFFNFLIDNDLMDLYSRNGKATGGFCNSINKYKSPFIFANLNGTNSDIEILTHEAGHAFAGYLCNDIGLMDYFYTTLDASEIQSFGMEFFSYPWLNLFFKEDADKYKYSHVVQAILFLPYQALVDEYQHWVYENPYVSPKERNSKWRELEKIYMPYVNYGDNNFLENGGRWMKQSHIYKSPFYYIDYALAQVCAFQFWSKAIHKGNEEFKNVFQDYINYCRQGGSKSFLELIKYANLDSPFDEKVIKRIMEEVEEYLFN